MLCCVGSGFNVAAALGTLFHCACTIERSPLNGPRRYVARTVTLSPPFSCFSCYSFLSTVLPSPPLQSSSHFVHMIIGTDNHMKTVLSGMLFGLVARNLRQLVGSRRVGREVEALSLTINRSFGYSWNHYCCWTYFIFAFSIWNSVYRKISRNIGMRQQLFAVIKTNR
jgi:hypothetical protein